MRCGPKSVHTALHAMAGKRALDEPRLDQLFAEPIVKQLMHRDRIDEATIRRLLRQGRLLVVGHQHVGIADIAIGGECVGHVDVALVGERLHEHRYCGAFLLSVLPGLLALTRGPDPGLNRSVSFKRCRRAGRRQERTPPCARHVARSRRAAL
jgi:hypothetical protein